ncbi:MAG: L-rhamnose mutarotase [Bacteroidota bacterium]
METIAFKMKLYPGFKEEYRRRHADIWPDLHRLLKEYGISDYSIFLDEETDILFAVQKLEPMEDRIDLRSHPVMKQWWDYMADIMDVNSDNSPVVTPLVPVFHMD